MLSIGKNNQDIKEISSVIVGYNTEHAKTFTDSGAKLVQHITFSHMSGGRNGDITTPDCFTEDQVHNCKSLENNRLHALGI